MPPADRPNVIVPSEDITLTLDQERKMVEKVRAHLDAVQTEMGAGNCGRDLTGWMLQRQREWGMYEDSDFDFRKGAGEPYGKLYTYSNHSQEIEKRIILTSTAKVCEQLVDTDPFVSLIPIGQANASPEVDSMDRILRDELKRAKAQQAFRDGVEQAKVSGEAVMKVTEEIDPSEEELTARVWMAPIAAPHPETGEPMEPTMQPLRDSKGNPITEKDQWVQDSTDINAEMLEHDPTTKKPQGAALSSNEVTVRKKQVRRHLHIAPVAFQDFFCSLLDPDIHTARAIHQQVTYEWEDLYNIAQANKKTLSEDALAWMESLPQRGISSEEHKNSEQVRLENANLDGQAVMATIPNGKVLCIESWFRLDPHDAEQGANAKELYMLWDYQSKIPIRYRLTEKVSPTGKRPYRVLRCIKKKNRWWGISIYHFLRMVGSFLDRQVCRLDLRSSTSGLFKWYKKGVFPQIDAGQPFTFNGPQIYEANSTIEDPSKAVGFLATPPMDESIWKLKASEEQVATLMTGTMTPGEAATSNFKVGNGTATGINALAAEADLMSSYQLQLPREAIEECVQMAAQCVFREYDQRSAAETIGADKAQALAEWLKQNKVSRILKHVRLLLTKIRTREQLQSNGQAWQLLAGAKSYFELTATNPQMAKQAKPLIDQMLKALDIEDVNSITDLTKIIAELLQQQQAAAAQPPPQ